MKRIFFTCFCISCITTSFAQSITLESDGLQLPCVETNPVCTVNEKGKLVYNTTKNKVFYCNGTVWVNPETPTNLAFYVGNVGSVELKNTSIRIPFFSKYYDLTNSFQLNTHPLFPNVLIVPENGIYEFRITANIQLDGFVPEWNTRIRIGISSLSEQDGELNYYDFIPVHADSRGDYFTITRSMRLWAGGAVYFTTRIEYDETEGTVSLSIPNVTGRLISRL